MFYAIDFDTRKVESKSENEELLAAYILDNDLSQAVALIDSADELCLQFSLDEMNELHKNICETDVALVDDEELLADIVWEILEESKNNFPDFTPAIGKKLMKVIKKEISSKPNKVKGSTKPKTSSPRVNLNRDDPICVLQGKGKSGSILSTILIAIDDELCDTVGEVVDYIIANHVIPKTGELADVKFAEHNIKYFVKKGNIALEEGL
jgi:hypothetical protein